MGEAGALPDSLSAPDDGLRPYESWLRMRLDRSLGVGGKGGHGAVRHTVVEYAPGRWVRFRFTGRDAASTASAASTSTSWSLLAMRVRGPDRLTWPLFRRRQHDAVIEDSLDRAEGGRRSRWGPYVRLLRRTKGLR
ncbi:SRPBCC family protein [Streptomyces sp. NBC_01210]|uniref:SRPBCC family protein n=1 Tax=Streptomyces sp. NBC_01210 TaxID=2903774 RepID=UPI002E0FD15F|nr:SRPBCC family protein [Streptomyces sp. NBC_01210]